MTLSAVVIGSAKAIPSSWLSHSLWVNPLASLVTAVGAIIAVLVAVFIGWQARNVASVQAATAGLAELHKRYDEYESVEFRPTRRTAALSALLESVDETSMTRVLNWIEELAIYYDNRLLSLKIIEQMASIDVLCWWYVLSARRHRGTSAVA